MAHRNIDGKACSTKNEHMTGSLFSRVSHWVYRHPIVTLIFTFVALLLLPFLIIALIKRADTWFPNLQFTRLNDGINIWLGFWGSYLGCVATVILSVGAILLNEKINQYTWHKNTVDQVSEFNNFEVASIVLYHRDRSYPVKVLARLPDMNYSAKFAILVIFQKPFPPHYRVDIEEIHICKDYNELDASKPVDIKFTSLISNCKSTELLFLSDDETLGEFYCSPLTNENTAWKERHYWLRLQLNCDNRLYESNRPKYYKTLQIEVDLWLFSDSIDKDNSAKIEIEERKIFAKFRRDKNGKGRNSDGATS